MICHECRYISPCWQDPRSCPCSCHSPAPRPYDHLEALAAVARAAERHLAHVSPSRDFDMDHVGLRAALDALRRP